MIDKCKLLASLATDIDATRRELEKDNANPNLRTRIGLESKLKTLEDLHDTIRIGIFDEGGGLDCTASEPTPTATLQVQHTERGFEYVTMDNAIGLQQSSAIGEYEDAFERPGSSFLWFGESSSMGRDHLSREEVRTMLENNEFDPMLVPHARAWLETGSLNV